MKSHHHHHHDETGQYRRQMEKSVRMRKLLPKVLFATGCIIATIMVLLLIASYTIG